LDLTTKMLQINPEFYTVWNYRRNIYLNAVFPNSTPEQINEILRKDLVMITIALKTHPKVYWIWNHRRWCLEQTPDGPGGEGGDPHGWRMKNWKQELSLVEKMLDADARNFHAWGYRRYVLASIPVKRPDIEEFAYTTKKIEANFSNFSAWHQRSKIYPLLWESDALDHKKSREDEFELVRNAMYTDPEDQSVWVYHRWLVGSGEDAGLLKREIQAIKELLEEEAGSKWCLESLVHYQTLLVRRHYAVLGEEECERLRAESLEWLQQLEVLDPLRKQRYRDLASTAASNL